MRIAVLNASLVLGLAAAISVAPAQAPVGAAELVDTVELRVIVRQGRAGWMDYPGDGTPRGDTVRALLNVGMWELEGGDVRRGLRLVRAAFRLGVVDSLAYVDFGQALYQYRSHEEGLALYDEATRRWPGVWWAWDGRARMLRTLGRTREAAAAQLRADSLRAHTKRAERRGLAP